MRGASLTALAKGSRGPALIALASVAIVGSAIASQVWGGLNPCKLCIYQRIPYAFTILAAAAAAALAWRGTTGAAALLTFLCAAAFAAGAAVAAFHVGVEQDWWEGTTSCTGVGAGAARTVEELRALLETAPVIRCDEVQWSLLGISMAGYNFLISLGLMAFAAFTARRLQR